MDTAASTGGGGFGFDNQASSEGYAIPIERAVSIAEKIASGQGGTNIHLGGTRALLGVSVDTSQSQSSGGNGFGGGNGFFGGGRNGFGNGNDFGNGNGNGNGGSGYVRLGQLRERLGSGRRTSGVRFRRRNPPGSSQGDVITAVDGQTIDSNSALAPAITAHNPHDKVRVDWTDSSGDAQHTTVELGSGPPA